jgi:poly-gamma-glutamate synthesis protein (capsule biosynthesis protein)
MSSPRFTHPCRAETTGDGNRASFPSYAVTVIRLRWSALFLAAALTAAACDTSPPASSEPKRAPSTDEPVASPSPAAHAQDVTLAFAGDVHFAGRAAKLLDDPATAIGPTAALLAEADVAMVNLETAITGGGQPEPKQFRFRAPATAFTALRDAGVDVATMANNHAMDYGRSGLADTLASVDGAAYPVVGVGRTAAQAYAPWVTEVRGTKIAFLGLSQIRERAPQWSAQPNRSGVASALDIPTAAAAVAAAREVADVVVVYLHWGEEGNACPTDRMTTLASALAGAGADAIVSTHAHLLLGDGYLGRTYVQYGLGNFVWWRDDAFSNDTGVLTLTLRGRQVAKAALTPARISATGQPVPATGAEARRISAEYAKLRACTGLSSAPTS